MLGDNLNRGSVLPRTFVLPQICLGDHRTRDFLRMAEARVMLRVAVPVG